MSMALFWGRAVGHRGGTQQWPSSIR